MEDGKQIFCYEKNFDDRGVTIDKTIMRDEMENANVFQAEEQVSMTRLAAILASANNMCFQVCFNCKADEKSVAEKLAALKAAPKGAAALK